MYADFALLFSYRQYVDYPVRYYFDRTTYRICEEKLVPLEVSDSDKRYIAMFQIDEDAIAIDFIKQMNDRKLFDRFNRRAICVEEFLQQHGLWDRWWLFYRKEINKIVQKWCNEHFIKYKPLEEQHAKKQDYGIIKK